MKEPVNQLAKTGVVSRDFPGATVDAIESALGCAAIAIRIDRSGKVDHPAKNDAIIVLGAAPFRPEQISPVSDRTLLDRRSDRV